MPAFEGSTRRTHAGTGTCPPTSSPAFDFRRASWAVAFWCVAFLSAVAGRAPAAEPAKLPAPNSSASCLECHGDRMLAMRKGGQPVALFVDAAVAAKSVHASLECTDCHEKFDGDSVPHRSPIVTVDCTSCHDGTAKKHGFHPRMAQTPMPAGRDTACAACHGKHDIAAVKNPAFAFNDGTQADSCGQCHQAARDQFKASAHGRAFVAKEANAPECLSCHREPVVALAPAKLTLEQKLAQTRQCESCHVGKENVAGQSLRGVKFVSSFDHSVHGAALQAGKVGAANCVDCHGAHEMNRGMAGSARVNKLHVAETCAKCHEQPAAEFGQSVHAAALRKGNLDSAACTDCHGEHDIRRRADPSSPISAKNVAQEVCANCHASLRLTQKYGLPSQSFQTFADSYHGLAVRGGAVEVVNCASCHSSHAIKSQTDPTSTIHPTHLAQTCGQCHPGANTRFAMGKVHVSPEAAQGAANSPVLYLISSLYVILIVLVVGGMMAHNACDLLKKVRRKLAIQKGLVEPEHVAHRLYLRMTVHERWQHAVLVVSFTLLVVTGFMLRYPEAWWVVGIRNLSVRAFEWRSWIHRIAGVVLLVSGVWHFCYLAFTANGRSLFRDILPRWRDVTDPIGVMKYNLGLAPVKPRFGRFCYIEKAEYWAMMWGTFLMGLTGFMLWFDNTSIGLFTKLGFDIARTVHFYEAVLATLAIIVWHFYFVIFNPDIYPMNLAWLTGRMSEEELLEEHPLQLEQLKAAEAAKSNPDSTTPPTSPPPG